MPGQLRILEGATFCICDEVGDLHHQGEGLFSEDTRFLSRFKLTINGHRPLLLSSDKIEYFSAAFFMRNPLAGGLDQDVLSIRRERFVGEGMQDSFAVQNQGMNPVEFDFELEVASDFADIFAVKDYDFALGDPLRAKPLPDPRPNEYDEERNQFLISDNGDLPLKTQVIFSERGEVNGTTVKFHLTLEPRERWDLGVEVIPLPDGELVAPRFAERRFGEEVGRVRDSLAAWQLRVPQLRASGDALSHSFGHALSEVGRWTDDAALVRDLKRPALAALEWIDKYGDRDGDGFIEYERRTEHGLENQSWKDSWDSQRFHDGTLAQPPIAPCEVQGYVYDAKRRVAELAREVWRDRELGGRLETEAEELRRRFDEAFWIEERGGFYALALDRDKRRVDSLCSNIGHLLWSGIVPPERVDAIVDRLMGDELWSGWGVRTMSTGDAGYNPLSYHAGTVWPHDNSLIAWGLGRYARWPEAQRIVQRMLTASRHFGYQLPEVFAGLRRSETPFPIAYPTAARPQAWAAGTPVLLLQVLLGLKSDRRRHALETNAPVELPSWAGTIRLSGVRAFDRLWDVRLEAGS